MLQAKYIPGVRKLAFQDMFFGIKTKKSADPTYNDFQNLIFHVLLPVKNYANLNSMHLRFPIKVSKSTDRAEEIRSNLITVNTFCA